MRQNDSNAPRQFEIEPPGSTTRVLLWVLSLVLPLVIVGLALRFELGSADPARLRLIADSPAITGAVCMGVLVVVLLPVTIWLNRSLRRSVVELDRGVLALRAGWYRHRVAVSDLDLSRSRVLSLDEFPEYRPFLKSNAISLPGYKAGHFRLRNLRGKAFCILTSHQKILMLQERNGRVLLLGLRQPRSLLDALKDADAG
jgi:hypothetical protein